MPRARDDQEYQEQRSRIARAAARVFAAKGFRDATNREIAAAAGISPALIYWYFTSKEELFIAAFEHLGPGKALQLPPETVETMPPDVFFLTLARQVLAVAARQETQQVMRMVLTEAIRFPSLAASLEEIAIRPAARSVATYIERRVADGTLHPTEPWIAAQIFLGSLMGYVIRKYLLAHADLHDADDDEMAMTLSRIFLRGLLAGEPPLAADAGDQAGTLTLRPD